MGVTPWQPPQGTRWIAAGASTTTVLSQVIGATATCLNPKTDCYFYGFYLWANRTDNNAQRPIGRIASEAQFQNVLFEGCKFFGNVDVLQVVGSATLSIAFKSCTFNGGFDLVATSVGANLQAAFDTCVMLADATLLPAGYTAAGVTCRCVALGGSSSTVLTFTGGNLTAKNASTTNDGIAIVSGSPQVTMDSVTVSGTTYDLDAGASGTIYANNCTLVHGTHNGNVIITP
ncbi:MAG: hypothetical protein ACTHN5_07815 [Phycisphaerae bacterium]